MNQRVKPISSREKKHIETIQRRIDYLSLQLANRDHLAKQTGSVNNMDYTRREIGALSWAIKQIEYCRGEVSHEG